MTRAALKGCQECKAAKHEHALLLFMRPSAGWKAQGSKGKLPVHHVMLQREVKGKVANEELDKGQSHSLVTFAPGFIKRCDLALAGKGRATKGAERAAKEAKNSAQRSSSMGMMKVPWRAPRWSRCTLAALS